MVKPCGHEKQKRLCVQLVIDDIDAAVPASERWRHANVTTTVHDPMVGEYGWKKSSPEHPHHQVDTGRQVHIPLPFQGHGAIEKTLGLPRGVFASCGQETQR